MKIKLLKSLTSEIKQRRGAALILCLCLLLLALTSGAAQVRNQRRVTALQLGAAAEGSRVTVVSDSALGDYEAFRRGDRFYVKIPLADFAATPPRFRADGFEDVQVQRVGDSLVVSFRLQPGASARVDQRGNRLDVIFSSPNRSAANTGSNRVLSGQNPPVPMDRGRDTAGPLPPGSGPASRDRFATGRSDNVVESRTPQNSSALTSAQSDSTNRSKKGGNSLPPNGSTTVPSPSPVKSPSSVLASGSTPSYSPPIATPAVSPVSRSVATSPTSGGVLNWRQRGSAALKWVSANRMATLLGVLILLSLIGYLLMVLRSRQKGGAKAKRAKVPKVQPKYSPDAELSELSRPTAETHRPVKNESANAQAGSGVLSERATTASRQPQPAAAAAASASSHQWVLTKPTIGSPTAGPDEYSGEEEEREVFEL